MSIINSASPLAVRWGQARRSYKHLGLDTTGTCLLTAEDTGGAFSLFDVTFGPGDGVPPHVHANEDEIFYMLEGECTFQVGERMIKAGPGACLRGPKKVAHSPMNTGNTPCRMLVLATPGGFERFFDALESMGGIPNPPTPEAMEAFGKLCHQYGMEPALPAPTDATIEIAPVNAGGYADLGDHRGYVQVSSQETEGALLLCFTEADLGGGVPPHIHTREDETFYVLSGKLQVTIGEQTIEATAGDTIFAPRHIPHSWYAVGDGPCQFLLVVTPGANFEAFALAMAVEQIIPSEPEGLAKLMALAENHGLQMLPPAK